MQKVERVGHLDEDPEFYSKKRELMAENSLADASTQIERISNLISSYVVEAPKDNSHSGARKGFELGYLVNKSCRA